MEVTVTRNRAFSRASPPSSFATAAENRGAASSRFAESARAAVR